MNSTTMQEVEIWHILRGSFMCKSNSQAHDIPFAEFEHAQMTHHIGHDLQCTLCKPLNVQGHQFQHTVSLNAPCEQLWLLAWPY